MRKQRSRADRKMRAPSETWLLRTLHDLRRADALRSLDGGERSPRVEGSPSPLAEPAFPAEPVESLSDSGSYPRSGP